ncbi:MAG: DUF2125 domain-containing protein [Magnetospirillum sp.]|nr:DUF2125 domain-containing protein [Magnetospirillum sp.]
MTIRRLLAAAAAAAILAGLGWSAYWFHVAGLLRKQIAAWEDTHRGEGWHIAHGEPTAGGFPIRLRLHLPQPALTRPDGLSWQAETLTVTVDPFDLTHLTLEVPGRQQIAWPGLSAAVAAESARILLDVDAAGRVQALEAQASAVVADSPDLGHLSLGGLTLAVRPVPVAAPDHRTVTALVAAHLSDLAFDALPGLVLDPRIEQASLSLRVLGALPAGLGGADLAAWSNDGGTVEIDELALEWEPLALEGEGTLALDRDLQPQAALSARVRGFDGLMDRLAGAGAVDPGAAGAGKMMLSLMAKPDRNGRLAIQVPITLQDGFLWLGPARVARLPMLAWP